jgi:[acyl-carrier-protein] S-malonyltransferase
MMAPDFGVAYVFPGQGAQTVGMGRDLYDAVPAGRRTFEEADAALGFSLTKLCFEGPEDALKQTSIAQPAILATSIACLRSAQALLGEGLVEPDLVAGHSLGEYTALVVAGALSFEDALRLVRERGRLMQEAGEREPGTMAAVLNLDMDILRVICEETGAEAANINTPDQVVISGPVVAVQAAMALASEKGARRVVPLQVSGAFHSRLMAPAKPGMAEAIRSVVINDPIVPVISNCTAGPLTSADQVREELVRQLVSPVQWHRSVEYMVEQGIETFYEIGPGRVLSGLIKRIAPEAKVHNFNELAALTPVPV